MAKYRKAKIEATEKEQTLTLQLELPMAELMAGVRDDIEALITQVGLKILSAVMDEEVKGKLGKWGQQSAHRHGHQAGYVVYAGRKLEIKRPRVRSKEQGELPLQSYQAFQQAGRMQRAVARKLMRHCSTRNYEGALDECLEGYGIKRSSVSRHFKVSTAAELKELLERPVPADLLALMLDAK